MSSPQVRQPMLSIAGAFTIVFLFLFGQKVVDLIQPLQERD